MVTVGKNLDGTPDRRWCFRWFEWDTPVGAHTHTYTDLTDSLLVYQGRWGELVPLEPEPCHYKRGPWQERDLPNQRAASECPSLEARYGSRCILVNFIHRQLLLVPADEFKHLLIPFQTAGLRWSLAWWSWAGVRGRLWLRWSRWRRDTDARTRPYERRRRRRRHDWHHSAGDHWANGCTDLHRSHMPFDHEAVQGIYWCQNNCCKQAHRASNTGCTICKVRNHWLLRITSQRHSEL